MVKDKKIVSETVELAKMKYANDQKQIKSVYLALAAIFIIGAISLVLATAMRVGSDNAVEFDCSIEGINYTDVRPAKCFGNFSDRHCPMPTNIKCSGRAENILASIIGAAR